jgi:hypothetical protein
LSSKTTHELSAVIPIGTISYLLRSITLMMEFAEMQEIECSEERPPNKTPTLIFSTELILFVLCGDWLIK